MRSVHICLLLKLKEKVFWTEWGRHVIKDQISKQHFANSLHETIIIIIISFFFLFCCNFSPAASTHIQDTHSWDLQDKPDTPEHPKEPQKIGHFNVLTNRYICLLKACCSLIHSFHDFHDLNKVCGTWEYKKEFLSRRSFIFLELALRIQLENNAKVKTNPQRRNRQRRKTLCWK